MSAPSTDPIVKFADAMELCLTGMVDAIKQFRASYRPNPIQTVTIIREPAIQPIPSLPVPLKEKEILTVKEAAELLRLKVETLYKWRKTGSKGPRSYGDGRSARFRRSDIEKWLESQARETSDSLKQKPQR